MGVASTCRLFQILKPLVDGEDDSGEVVRLGVKRRRHAMTSNSAEAETFLQACCKNPLQWPESLALPDLAAAARRALIGIGRVSSALQTKVDGYVCDHLVRKLVMRRLVSEARCQRFVDWSSTSISEVRLVSPDASEFLAQLPARWSAAEASSFFFGRPDWACFISMYACLWKEVAQAWPEEADALLVICRSQRFSDAVESLKECQGVAPRPVQAMRQCR